MFCPKCKRDMNQYNKNGIIIDTCPHCQGIWLDRGELEKILEQEIFNTYGHNQTFDQNHEHHDYHDKHHEKHHDYHHGNYNDYKHHKKKKGIFGILEDIFD